MYTPCQDWSAIVYMYTVYHLYSFLLMNYYYIFTYNMYPGVQGKIPYLPGPGLKRNKIKGKYQLLTFFFIAWLHLNTTTTTNTAVVEGRGGGWGRAILSATAGAASGSGAEGHSM